MSPDTAQALLVGSYVASRGEPDNRKFSHVAKVIRKTKSYFWLRFAPGPHVGGRCAFADKGVLRTLRTASAYEAAGYVEATK